MDIKEIKNKKQWEDFVLGCQSNSFLQSWNMGELHEQLGDKIFRLGIFTPNNELKGVTFSVEIKARRGSFLYLPHGPLFQSRENFLKYFATLIEYLKNLGKKEKLSFIRISPLLENKPEHQEIFNKNGFHQAPIHVLAETTWLLDITGDESEILKGMRKTTRNLIRRAQKEGVVINQSTNRENIEIFLKLHDKTVQRHHFVPYSNKYLRSQIESFINDDQVKVFTAKYQEKILAAAIIMFYGNQAAYHHGASLNSKIPASYLLQWGAICEAKKRGLKTYNFWGIVEGKPHHPWVGLSLFKKGFGGYSVYWLPAQDLALNSRYWLTYTFETLRRLRRYH